MVLTTLTMANVSLTAAWILFAVSYAVFAFGRLPGTKLDRTAVALIAAVLMFVFGVLDRRSALSSIDFATIVLLFSMMLIVAGLHLAGFFDRVADTIAERIDPPHLLPGIIFASGILSAFLVNDVVCLFMAPLVLRLSRQLKRPAVPMLLALATASNIGSVATITGNPQNILIGSLSGIRYVRFLTHLGPVAAIGLLLDWAILHWYTERKYKGYASNVEKPLHRTARQETHLAWPLGVMALVIAGFFAGYSPAPVAALGGALMLLGPGIDRQRIFEEIDWSLLVLFMGLFLILGGAERAGIAGKLLAVAQRGNLHDPFVLSGAVTLLSNVVSNVPAVMLLKGIIPQMADPQRSWMLLALTSTLAGNLTITGSVANIIVVEKARDEAPISFWEYLQVGVPVTLATLIVGIGWLLYVAR